MLQRLINTVSFHPFMTLVVLFLALGPFDDCPLR
jgi:hypothetical protein